MFKPLTHTIPRPLCQQQVRNASSGGRKKKRITSYRSDLRKFLGPRNFKGMYTKNPFFWAAKDNAPNYMTHFSTRGAFRPGVPDTNWDQVFGRKQESTLRPFSENMFCKSNLLVADQVKEDILRDYYKNKVSVQKIGFKYGISIPRIEALIKLNKIERETVSGTNPPSDYFFF